MLLRSTHLDKLHSDLLGSVHREHLVIVIGIEEHVVDVLLSGCTGDNSATSFAIDSVVSETLLNYCCEKKNKIRIVVYKEFPTNAHGGEQTRGDGKRRSARRSALLTYKSRCATCSDK